MSQESNAFSLKIYYQNVEGLRTPTKQEQLKKSLREQSNDLIIFVETNLDVEVKTEDLFDENYQVIRKDRQERAARGHGGGILIATLKNSPKILSSSIREDLSSGVSDRKEVEDVWVTLNLSNEENLHLCVVYLRPSCRKIFFEQFFNKLRANFNNRNKSDKFIIVGDFNFDDYRKLKAGVIKTKRKDTKLDIMNKCTIGLKQINKINNLNDKMLDMAFTNAKGSVTISSFQLVKAQSNHPPLEINLTVQKSQTDVDRSGKLEEELKGLRKSFESFKISHDTEIQELRKEIKILRGILEDEGMI